MRRTRSNVVDQYLILVQTRECDGQCCREGPRFPNDDSSDCRYHVETGCLLMMGVKAPAEPSVIFPDRTAVDVFQETCLAWPQNSTPGIGKPGGCCWEWLDG